MANLLNRLIDFWLFAFHFHHGEAAFDQLIKLEGHRYILLSTNTWQSRHLLKTELFISFELLEL